MAQPELSHRLASLDATFLYYERKEIPFHVGSTMIFDGKVSVEDFKRMILTKLPLLPRYQQKVVPAPFNVGHPTWEFDTEFDINQHIFYLQLDSPGTMEQLRQLTEKLQSRLLDRDKPLWEMYVIDGLEGDRCAMVSKVHHAMVDGVSGVDLMNAAFDLTPNPPPLPEPKPKAATPPPPPRPYNVTRRYIDSLLDSVEESMKSWTSFQQGLLNLTEGMLKEAAGRRTPVRPAPNPLVSLAAPVTPMPFNQRISAQRKVAWSMFSFAEARAIRTALGGTVNDVALTVVAGAIRRYLESHNHKTRGSFLRIMVPVSMRREEQRGALGNLVSVMPTEVPMDIKDPLELYTYINKKTKELKEAHVAEELNIVSALLGIIPPPMQAIASSLVATSIPLFNIVCTNVPGPQVPLYVLGRKLVASYAYVPIGYATGLTCAIFSYDQKLFFSLTSDTKLMPDLETSLKPFLDESFADLRNAAGLTRPEAPVSKLPEVTLKAPVATQPEVVPEPPVVVPEVTATVAEVQAVPAMPVAEPEVMEPGANLVEVAEPEVESLTPIPEAIAEVSEVEDTAALEVAEPEVELVVTGKELQQEPVEASPVQAVAPESQTEAMLPEVTAASESDPEVGLKNSQPKTVEVEIPARKKSKKAKTSEAIEPITLET